MEKKQTKTNRNPSTVQFLCIVLLPPAALGWEQQHFGFAFVISNKWVLLLRLQFLVMFICWIPSVFLRRAERLSVTYDKLFVLYKQINTENKEENKACILFDFQDIELYFFYFTEFFFPCTFCPIIFLIIRLMFILKLRIIYIFYICYILSWNILLCSHVTHYFKIIYFKQVDAGIKS